MCFLALDIPKTSDEVNNLLETGTHLFSSISTSNNYLMINELPRQVTINGKTNVLSILNPRAGMVSQTTDDPDALAFTLESATRQCFGESDRCFITIGNSPGSTIGVRKDNGVYTVCDSHSRDDTGRCAADGKAVIMQCSSLMDLTSFLRRMASSLTTGDQQFEITPITLAAPLGNTTFPESSAVCSDTTGPPESSAVCSDTTGPPESSAVCSDTTGPPESSAVCSDTTGPSESSAVCSDTTGPPESSAVCSDTTGPEILSACSESIGPEPTSAYSEGSAHPLSDVSSSSCRQTPPILHQVSNESNIPDISEREDSASDQMKYNLIKSRKPPDSFKFPSKQYKDKRKATGEMKRYCQHEWFRMFDFIAYSKVEDGIYCLACRLFPDSSHRRSKKFTSEPYRNWKDAIVDLKSHAVTEYHLASAERLKAFIHTYENPSHRIDVAFAQNASETIEENRKILKSITKSLIFCGRQGLALRGHRDDDSEKCEGYNHGNFKELLNFRIDAGDEVLANHLKTCRKNAKYTSKTSQNQLLVRIKEYIQKEIVKEINTQSFGPLFGIQCDEVTDISNWEQLGIVLRYTRRNMQIERLLEFVPCESTSGEAICQNILNALASVGIDVQNCRSQTMDGAGNMSGKYNGCAAKLQQVSPKATYHYCSSHDLNLVLCKSCQVREVHLMLDSLQQLGIFFRYSPKRSRRLEDAVESVNTGRAPANRITKTKVKVFCETRWVEKITTLQDFKDLYEAVLECLDAIGFSERGWDSKAVTEAYGLLKRIRDSTFIVSFQTVLHFFGYMLGLSKKLQGTDMDVIQAYDMVGLVKDTVKSDRADEAAFNTIFAKSEEMANSADITLEMPRRCGRQTYRSNMPAEDTKVYYRRTVFIPFVDSVVQQMDMRFNTLAQQALRGLYLLPCNLSRATDEVISSTIDFYKTDLPSHTSFHHELELWKRLWSTEETMPNTISSTLTDPRVCPVMFPNITKILYLLQLVAVSSSGVERGNSYLKYIKRASRSTMGEDRLNALLLLYVHRDIEINVDEVVDMYARRHPRRMLFLNPLSDD